MKRFLIAALILLFAAPAFAGWIAPVSGTRSFSIGDEQYRVERYLIPNIPASTTNVVHRLTMTDFSEGIIDSYVIDSASTNLDCSVTQLTGTSAVAETVDEVLQIEGISLSARGANQRVPFVNREATQIGAMGVLLDNRDGSLATGAIRLDVGVIVR